MTATRVDVNVPGGSYEVLIEPGLAKKVGEHVRRVAPHTHALLAVDEGIADTHGPTVQASLEGAGYDVTVVPLRATEPDKTMPAVQRVHQAMLAAGGAFDRAAPVVACGGGIVGDTAGFAAATFLRGVPLVQVPTTLLAMVDASVGGKTGINVDLPDGRLGKNLVGAFWQPRVVLADPHVLATLPPRDLHCGLAECVKAALIADASLLELLETAADDLLLLEDHALVEVVQRSVAIKAAIVAADEREAGARALLNLGHTFAHAIEAHTRLGLRHGEAVSIGLLAAAECAVLTDRLYASDATRIEAVLHRFELPLRLPQPLPVGDLMQTMRFDKKRADGHLRLVLPRGLGAAEIVVDVPDEIVTAGWATVGAEA